MATIPASQAVILQQSSAVQAFMPIMELQQVAHRHNAVNAFIDSTFREGIDYGVIPGTNKPTLLKPGAERICTLFGWTARFTIDEKIVTWDGPEPMAYYQVTCSLYRGDYLIAEGTGSASTRESKYRYRWVAEADVPDHLDKATLPQKDGTQTFKEWEFALKKRETGGKYGKPESYWEQFDKAIADGSVKVTTEDLKDRPTRRFAVTIGARVFRIPNPDIFDQFNTVLKMAFKRGHVAVALTAGNLSDRFTQDTEDMPEFGAVTAPSAPSTPFDDEPRPAAKTAAPPPAAAPKAIDPEGPITKALFEQMKKEAIDAGWTEKGLMGLLRSFGATKAAEIKNKHYGMVQAKITEAAALDSEPADDGLFPGGHQDTN
jgi:hypothetical protein